ncbi:hypothetical protein DICVIV_13733 [Dictyocaulus viviparus]|uniref:Uncharacterized protein n=1 Tax=Dictyocaulus viviparus TaxID=29172 RepID=A0A0D8XD31_DICVI|nr:hypothetical protein DICVIV_13733 [Dictyocaulus viviparus]
MIFFCILESRLSLCRPESSEMSIIYSSEGFPVRIIKNNQILHRTSSDAILVQVLSSPGSEHLRSGFVMDRDPQANPKSSSLKQRAESIPRRRITAEKSSVEIAGNGWYDGEDTTRSKEEDIDLDDIPAIGYSGHMPGLRQLSIGKSFNKAAREAKRDHAIRRRAQSSSRGIMRYK